MLRRACFGQRTSDLEYGSQREEMDHSSSFWMATDYYYPRLKLKQLPKLVVDLVNNTLNCREVALKDGYICNNIISLSDLDQLGLLLKQNTDTRVSKKLGGWKPLHCDPSHPLPLPSASPFLFLVLRLPFLSLFLLSSLGYFRSF